MSPKRRQRVIGGGYGVTPPEPPSYYGAGGLGGVYGHSGVWGCYGGAPNYYGGRFGGALST